MIHRSKTAQRGWPCGCLHLFLTWYHSSCISAAFNDKPKCRSITISIVRAYPVRSETSFIGYILKPERKRSQKIVVRNCFRYLAKAKTRKQSFTICIADCISPFLFMLFHNQCAENIWRWFLLWKSSSARFYLCNVVISKLIFNFKRESGKL